jgi:hypothetical protein
MAHIRAQVREKVANILTSAGLTVFTNRTHIIQPAELPCVVITTDRENLELSTAKGYDRDVELAIRLYDRAYSGVDGDIDTNCVLIENAMRNDLSLLAHEKNLESITIDIADGDQQIAVATMVYSILLYNIEDPEELI